MARSGGRCYIPNSGKLHPRMHTGVLFMQTDDRIAVGITEAARLVGRKRWFIHQEINAGRLPVQRPRPEADPLILMDDLRAWLRGAASNTTSKAG